MLKRKLYAQRRAKNSIFVLTAGVIPLLVIAVAQLTWTLSANGKVMLLLKQSRFNADHSYLHLVSTSGIFPALITLVTPQVVHCTSLITTASRSIKTPPNGLS
ncbi:hypothetical protein ACLKA7_000863 [Drosophila subpalustris]